MEKLKHLKSPDLAVSYEEEFIINELRMIEITLLIKAKKIIRVQKINEATIESLSQKKEENLDIIETKIKGIEDKLN